MDDDERQAHNELIRTLNSHHLETKAQLTGIARGLTVLLGIVIFVSISLLLGR